jgi:hypothetical protein
MEQDKGVRRCTGGRGREYEGEGGAWLTVGVEIVRGSSQMGGVPMRDFIVLGAS